MFLPRSEICKRLIFTQFSQQHNKRSSGREGGGSWPVASSSWSSESSSQASTGVGTWSCSSAVLVPFPLRIFLQNSLIPQLLLYLHLVLSQKVLAIFFPFFIILNHWFQLWCRAEDAVDMSRFLLILVAMLSQILKMALSLLPAFRDNFSSYLVQLTHH